MEKRYIENLRRALIQAYPDRTDVRDVQFDGTYAQAWQAFARILGIDTIELARVVAPVFGMDVSNLQEEIPAETVVLLPCVRYCVRIPISS